MTDMDRTIGELQAQMDEMMRKTHNVPEWCAAHTEILKAVNHQLDSINDNLTWIWRTIVGAVIVGIVGAALYFTTGQPPQAQYTGETHIRTNQSHGR